MATLQERLDPNSPHYDVVLAELRRKAYQAHEDHERDMATDPVYRDEYKKFEKRQERAAKRRWGVK